MADRRLRLSLEDDVKLFGDVVLTKDELELLKLGPGFMVVSNLDEQRHEDGVDCCSHKDPLGQDEGR